MRIEDRLTDYVVEQVVRLVKTPSLAGHTDKAISYVEEELARTGVKHRRTGRGALLVTLEGQGEGPQRALTAHVDTLGAMVKELGKDGSLLFTPVGGYALATVEGEYVTVETSAGTRKAIREQIVDYVKRGKIEVGLREFGTFSRHGHCRVCGYLARSYRRIQEIEQEVTEDVAELLEALGEEEKSPESGKKLNQMFCSALQFPAYRLLKNIFDTKICDEAHTLTGESMVYEAVS